MTFFDRIIKLISEYGMSLLEGVGRTLFLAIAGTLIGLVLSFFLVVLRIQKLNHKEPIWKRIIKGIGLYFSKGYIQLFRGTPMMVQAMIFYYGFSSIGIPLKPFLAGLVTVSLNTAAYLAEVLRGGIQAVDDGQREAARSLGFGEWKTFFLVILPQGLKNALPSIGNEIIVNIKDTAVLNVIQVVDLYHVAYGAGSRYAIFFEAMILVAAIYFILTFVVAQLLKLLERKFGLPAKELPSSN